MSTALFAIPNSVDPPQRTPQPWGTSLWRILHTLAERLGRSTIQLLQTDEHRTWLQLLRCIEHILPCPKCRAHYKEYKRRYPPEDLAFHGPLFRAAARQWLYRLHAEINTERGVPSPALEELEGLYGSRKQAQLQADLHEFQGYLQAGMLNSTVAPEAVHVFRAVLSSLRRTTG